MKRSGERQAVLDAIETAGLPVGPQSIAAMTGMPVGNVRRLLGKLAKEFAITKVAYGRYVRRTAPLNAQELYDLAMHTRLHTW
jgi:DNA-binding IclR family transcriptional regulator